jgi:phage N-6-adenine-methyltransferase
MGRRPIFKKPMTPTERMRRYRANKRQAEIAAGLRPARKKKPLTATQRGRRWRAKNKAARNRIKPYTGDDEWYTPPEHIARVRRVLGDIDLDPASNEQAQRIVQAGQFFSKADDALMQDWRGRVWLNPPYSKGLLAKFVDKMIHEVKVGNTTAGIMLLNNFTDPGWFQVALSACSAVCFPRRRVYFENASGKKDRPLNGQVFFYFGPDVDLFRSEFCALGPVGWPPTRADIADGGSLKIA